LHLAVTLSSGQSFRWRQDARGVWWGMIETTALALWQAEDDPESPLYWQTFPEENRREIIADYFRLDTDLPARMAEWAAQEPRIAPALTAFRGLRLLRQPPVECLFAFLCATAKPVPQIERLVWSLAARYGKPRAFPLSMPYAVPALYAFPTLEALAAADEMELRGLGWGYRAPRIIRNAQYLLTQPPGWLESLRAASYAEARMALMELSGIGPKVADCICLFALDKDEAAPVDRHIQRIACALFRRDLEGRSLTPAVYEALAAACRERFGAYAGWAQQYLFYGQLARAAQTSEEE
jgi:N-glycosylase/DNA lyase